MAPPVSAGKKSGDDVYPAVLWILPAFGHRNFHVTLALSQYTFVGRRVQVLVAPVDVHAVLEAAILGVREAALRTRLTLNIAVAEDANRFIADEARVRQVLYNLLSNAVGFSKPGGAIHVTCNRADGMIIFTVADQGVGIPKDQQWRMFERFESRSQGSGHRGAGIGLSIVKSLVELHGGTVSMESEPGLGTSVSVHLPEQGRPVDASEPPVSQAGPSGLLSAGGNAA